MHIKIADFDDPRVVDLLTHHATTARAQTGAGSAHALDLSGLQSPDIQVWTAWDETTLLAVGALRRFVDKTGEITGEVKAMHTAAAARGRGVGSAMLVHIIAAARSHGILRLMLETGSWPYFKPAIALYRRHGFVECPAFGGYAPDPNSVFMTLDLSQ